MSNYAAGPPGHGGYPPPGYPPPGYGPPGYGPPGYGPPGWGWKPGVIPLFSNSATRGLTLGDIFRGAVGYIRANPKATLGLTAAVVAVTSALARLVQFLGPSNDDNTGLAIFTLISAAATAFGTILLSGMLTVVVARAVFGSTITVGETWRRIRGRLPALIGMGALQLAAVVALIGGIQDHQFAGVVDRVIDVGHVPTVAFIRRTRRRRNENGLAGSAGGVGRTESVLNSISGP